MFDEDDEEFDSDDEFDEDDQIVSEQVIGYLINMGAAVWDGMDKDGARMFRFNMDVLQDVMPDMYDAVMEDLDQVMLGLYEEGLVEVEYDENLEAKFNISPEGKQVLKGFGFDNFYPDDEK
jgi:hypothetical protein